MHQQVSHSVHSRQDRSKWRVLWLCCAVLWLWLWNKQMNPPYLIEVDHDSILLGWEAVPDGIEYEIQMLEEEGVTVKEGDVVIADKEREDELQEGGWVSLSSSLKGTEARKKNVTHLHTYRFRMRVKYAYGWDLFSTPSERLSPAPPTYLLPDPPAVVGRDANSVTLEWTKVENASGYLLRYRVASTASGWVTIDAILQTNTVKKKGLMSNKDYYFSVKPLVEQQEGDEEGEGEERKRRQEYVFSRSSLRCSPLGQPRHNAKCGYTTMQGRKDWLVAHGVTQEKDIAAVAESLEADRDPHAPLYYWQLFSLLGLDRIHAMVTLFYQRVYADEEEEWFREAFVRISNMEHHITTQTQFWVDAMGGGKYYHGGDYRLTFHHEHNAESVMNARGAQRWMHHMRLAVADNERNPATSFAAIDPRVLPCLKDFLRTKMLKYSKQHDWKFDNSDFEQFPE